MSCVPTQQRAEVEVCSARALLRSVCRTGAAAWVALLQRTATPHAVAMEASATTVDAATGVATPAAKTRWELLCDKFSDVFSSLKGLPPPERVKHHIKLLDESTPPPKPRQYRMSPAEMAEIRRQLDEYLEKGVHMPLDQPIQHANTLCQEKRQHATHVRRLPCPQQKHQKRRLSDP